MELPQNSPSASIDPADVAIAKVEGRCRRRHRLLIAAAVLCPLVGYILSPVLFVSLERRGMLTPEMSSIGMLLLWPLHEAYMNVEIVHDFYDSYFELMGVKP